ncbi:MAG: glutathione peroxidase [Ignavibacteriales bacterium]
MFKVILILFIAFQITFANQTEKENKKMNVHEISVLDMNGKEVKLSDYKGKVLMIVNVASKCGYTKQYAGLESLYEKYKSKGFEILAFPCNDFGGQEPGTNKEIQEFCTATFGVKFKLFDKVKVLGENKSKLYSVLTSNENTETGDIKWNFEKFIISKNGEIVARFRSGIEPESKDVVSVIEAELKK